MSKEQMIHSNSSAPILPMQCYKQPFVELYNEDCLETLKRIETGSIDLIVQDPPYGTTNLSWDKAPNLPVMWEEWERVIKPNGAIIFTSQQPFTTDLINSNRKLFRYELIYKKTCAMGFLDAKKKPLRAHENILIFYKKLPTYNPQKTKSKNPRKDKIEKVFYEIPHYKKNYKKHYKDDGSRYPQSVIEFSNWNGGGFTNHSKSISKHPTQKPIELLIWLIKTYSNENDLVFDGYSGSGTTAIACLKEKRRFIGSELSWQYFDLSVKRLEEIRAKPELF